MMLLLLLLQTRLHCQANTTTATTATSTTDPSNVCDGGGQALTPALYLAGYDAFQNASCINDHAFCMDALNGSDFARGGCTIVLEDLDHLKYVGKHAFSDCPCTVTMKGSFLNLTDIRDRAFENNGQGSSLDLTFGGLPALKSIGPFAFYNGGEFPNIGRSERKLTITGEYPALAIIGQSAFRQACNADSAITFVGLPALKNIDTSAFFKVGGNLTITGEYNMLEKIASGAFYLAGNTATAITFGGLPALKSIGQRAFQYLGGRLTFTGEYPALETIDGYAFSSLGNGIADPAVITFIGLPALKSIGDRAFQKIGGNLTITGEYNVLETIGLSAFELAGNADSLIDLKCSVGENLTIGIDAFAKFGGTHNNATELTPCATGSPTTKATTTTAKTTTATTAKTTTATPTRTTATQSTTTTSTSTKSTTTIAMATTIINKWLTTTTITTATTTATTTTTTATTTSSTKTSNPGVVAACAAVGVCVVMLGIAAWAHVVGKKYQNSYDMMMNSAQISEVQNPHFVLRNDLDRHFITRSEIDAHLKNRDAYARYVSGPCRDEQGDRYDSMYQLLPSGAGTVPSHLQARKIDRKSIKLLFSMNTGSFGQILKAQYSSNEAPHCHTYPVAIKRVAVHYKVGIPSAETELLAEGMLMAQFDCEHLLGLVGICTDDGSSEHSAPATWLVLEYAEFGSLYSQLRPAASYNAADSTMSRAALAANNCREHFATVTDRLVAALEIATGCAYLESKHCIHRDLATRNVLVTSSFACKIADFGLSRGKPTFDLTSRGYYQSVKGTVSLRWAAPEAIMKSRFTPASDVWSFGVVMIELFTNAATPYKDVFANDAQLILSICDTNVKYRLRQPPTMPSDIYSNVVYPCWREDPQQRPTFSLLQEQLELGIHQVQSTFAKESIYQSSDGSIRTAERSDPLLVASLSRTAEWCDSVESSLGSTGRADMFEPLTAATDQVGYRVARDLKLEQQPQ